jgi:hypothetical protein
MERGGTTTVLQAAPNVVGGSTLCHQAVEQLTVNSTRRSV